MACCRVNFTFITKSFKHPAEPNVAIFKVEVAGFLETSKQTPYMPHDVIYEKIIGDQMWLR